jgi:hypothetical protein
MHTVAKAIKLFSLSHFLKLPMLNITFLEPLLSEPEPHRVTAPPAAAAPPK